jgi:hypothetical protein
MVIKNLPSASYETQCGHAVNHSHRHLHRDFESIRIVCSGDAIAVTGGERDICCLVEQNIVESFQSTKHRMELREQWNRRIESDQ